MLLASCPFGEKISSVEISTDAELAVVVLDASGNVRSWGWHGVRACLFAGVVCFAGGCTNGLGNERKATMTTTMETKKLGEQVYQIEPLLVEDFQNLDRWVAG